MTNLPKDLRAWLTENARLGGLSSYEIVGQPDQTQKIVSRTHDGHYIESVIMRDEPEDEDEVEPGEENAVKRLSLCISSQVGCALNCAFCMTGFGGFRRNLRADEIIDQVLIARRLIGSDERVLSIVFMGMGEPMLNLAAVVPALRIITSRDALNYATRRVTVSTAGVIPGIWEFGEARTGVNLAVSLNATTQEGRDRIMPGCRKWSIDQLLEACRQFPLIQRRRITFEYVLLKGINDSPDDMRRLPRLLKGIPCKINFILYNPDECLDLAPAEESTAERFCAAMSAAHFTVSLRRSKGREHQAACGQLAAHFRRCENHSP